ncbi:MAG TPA: hypothetical protein VF715_04705 [Thermoleophilaceae bacterium]
MSGDRGGRTAGIVLTVLLTLGALYLELMALLISAMTCDESCGATGRWRDDPDAWQWTFQLGWATAGLLLVGSSVAFAARGQGRAAIGAVTAGAVAFATWATFVGG